MEITDIIGKGKLFEPSFSPHSKPISFIIADAKQTLFVSVDYVAPQHIAYPERLKIRATLVQYICDLLNREFCKEGGEQ